MSDRFNTSGAKDPTAYIALNSKRLYMPRVYICTGFTTSRAYLNTFCRFAIRKGFSPFCRNLLYGGITTEDVSAHMGLIFLDCCTQIWVFGEITQTMRNEISRARSKGKPVRYFSFECREGYGE